MLEYFHELKRLREIINILLYGKKDKKLDLIQKLPVPSFEEFRKYYGTRTETGCYKIKMGNNVKSSEEELENIKVEYLRQTQYDLFFASHYRRKYYQTWYKFYQVIKHKKVKEDFLNENIYEVVDLLAESKIMLENIEDEDIAKVIPIPSEEEYCDEELKRILIVREKDEYYKQKYSQFTEEEIFNINKKDYKRFSKDLQSILTWYKIKEFKEKLKEREVYQINKLKMNFINNGLPQNKIDEELMIYIDNKCFEEIQAERMRLFRYYMRGRFSNNYEFEKQSDYDLNYPLNNEVFEKQIDTYRWLQDYGSYSTLKKMGLLPDEWYES